MLPAVRLSVHVFENERSLLRQEFITGLPTEVDSYFSSIFSSDDHDLSSTEKLLLQIT